MSVLATIDDVKRKLHIEAIDVDDERDGWLQDELDAAESWFLGMARGDWTATGAKRTLTFYEVLETDRLDMPAPGGTVQAIRVFALMDTQFFSETTLTLQGQDYDVDAAHGDWVRLRPSLVTNLPDLPQAALSRLPWRWRKVEVDWTPAAGALVVPAAIRDGLAMLAAGQFISSPRLAGGFSAERIGDYSYSVRPPAGGKPEGSPISEVLDFVMEGTRLLRPFLRRKPLVT